MTNMMNGAVAIYGGVGVMEIRQPLPQAVESVAQAVEALAVNAHISLRELKNCVDKVLEKKIPGYKQLMQSWHPSRSNGLFESRPRRSRNKSRQAHRLGQVGINPVGWQQNRKNPARASRWSSIPRTDTNWRIFWKRATPSAAVGVWRQDRTLLLPSRRVSSCSKASSRKH